jgi:hypothetical protein
VPRLPPEPPERAEPRGRPRLFCDATCRKRAFRVEEQRRRADEWEQMGCAGVAERMRSRIAVDLTLWRANS